MKNRAIHTCCIVIASALPWMRPRWCPADTEGPLTLARDGRALAPIVADPQSIAGFAAKELKQYLDRVTGATFRITSKADTPPRIFVGDCPAAQAAGLNVGELKRDGFYRAVVGDDLFLLGRDDRGGWRLNLFDYREKATLFAVYDFLEDVCDVRWFKSGPYGEVVPTKPTVAVPRGVLREEPAFLDRRLNQYSLHFYSYSDAAKHATKARKGYREEDRHLWGHRMRYGTIRMVHGCHSATYLKFGERFGTEHPEWFSLRADGTRAIKTGYGPHLCWSEPGVIDAFIGDARAYLTGQSPSARGLESWYGGGYGNDFMVDPSDSYTKCRCPKCLKTHGADPGQDYSEIIFGAVAKVADAVKDLEGKYITTLAYGPKRKPPKTVRLPPNVRVRLCTSGPSQLALPGSRAKQLNLIKQWSERMKGGLVLWVYTNSTWYHANLQGAVETMPHLIADFLRDIKPFVEGVFFENEANSHTNRFFDEYVILKLLWDPDQDVDALLNDYFDRFYGPAAEPMQRYYATLEELWTRVCSFYGGDKVLFVSEIGLWEQIYSPEVMAKLDELLREAERKAGDDPAYAWRVALIRDEMYRRISDKRNEFVKAMGLAGDVKLTCRRAPAAPDEEGLLPASAWQHAVRHRLGPASNRHGLSVLTHFKLLWDPAALHLLIECEEPDLAISGTTIDRRVDDPQLWQDNDIEVFLHRRLDQEANYQILSNDRGVLADRAKRAGAVHWDWDSESKAKVEHTDTGWTVRLAIPFAPMGIDDPLKMTDTFFNLGRHRMRRGKPEEFFVWSPLCGMNWHDTTRYGHLTFAPKSPVPAQPNLIKNGGLDTPGTAEQPVAGWRVDRSLAPFVALDRDTRREGRASARLTMDKFGTSVRLLQYLPELKPGAEYRFRCKVKIEDVKGYQPGKYGDGVHVRIWAPGVHPYIPLHAMTGTSDWRKIEFKIHPKKREGQTSKPYVTLNLRGSTGTAWFDEAELREVFKP